MHQSALLRLNFFYVVLLHVRVRTEVNDVFSFQVWQIIAIAAAAAFCAIPQPVLIVCIFHIKISLHSILIENKRDRSRQRQTQSNS